MSRFEAQYREIGEINGWSAQQAVQVLEDAARRETLAPVAAGKERRLLELVHALEAAGPAAYEPCSDDVSESLLDLDFIQRPTKAFSLRLGRERKRRG